MVSPRVQVTVPERTNVTASEQLSRASTPDAGGTAPKVAGVAETKTVVDGACRVAAEVR